MMRAIGLALDRRVWAYYNVTDTSSAWKILGSTSGISKMEVDGVEMPLSDTYLFGTTGEHLIQFTLNSLSSFPPQMFRRSAVDRVIIPSGVTTIMGRGSINGSFRESSLRSIFIPSSVSVIESTAFYSCSSLSEVHVESADDFFSIQFGDNIAADYANPLQYAHHLYKDGIEITNYVIPAGTIEIGHHAFYGANNMQITIPPSVQAIGIRAFMDCANMTSDVEVPVSVLNDEVFRGSNINSLTLPNVVQIGNSDSAYCLYYSNITLVDIGASCEIVKNRAFFATPRLSTLIVRATTPPVIAQYSFYYNNVSKVYVPYSADHSVLAAYKSDSNWLLNFSADKFAELNPDGTIPT